MINFFSQRIYFYFWSSLRGLASTNFQRTFTSDNFKNLTYSKFNHKMVEFLQGGFCRLDYILEPPPLPPPSEMTIFTWTMRAVLRQMKYQYTDFWDFLSYGQMVKIFCKRTKTIFNLEDAQCSKTDLYMLATILWFLVFELVNLGHGRIQKS